MFTNAFVCILIEVPSLDKPDADTISKAKFPPSHALGVTPNPKLPEASIVARSVLLVANPSVFVNNTLVAAANNDVLVGLDINPTFTNGAFTGVTNWGLRVGSSFLVDNTNNRIFVNATGTGTTTGATGSIQIGDATISKTFGSTFNINTAITVSGGINSGGINTTTGNGGITTSFMTIGSGFTTATIKTDSTKPISFFPNPTTESIRFFGTGNVLLQNGGTFTDAGFRLDVNGTARVQGELTVNGVRIGLGGGAISSNTRVGGNALNNNTSGANNSAFGSNALLNNTSGTNNSSFGQNALVNNTSGSANNSFGAVSLERITSGSRNIAIGFGAARFIADGTSDASTIDNSIIIGYNSRVLANSQTNQIVIGYDVTGLGSNTTVLGNTSTTLTALYGAVITGGTSVNASAQLQVDSTTKGFLPPRGTNAQRNAIASPAIGLVFYCTDATEGLYIYTASGWRSLAMV